MTESNLIQRIEKLSIDERKLVSIKLNELIKKGLLKTSAESPKKLVAYIQSQDAFTQEGLKLHLKDNIPDYMLPASIYEIEEVPLLPNGKVNKKALAQAQKVIRNQKDTSKEITGPSSKIEAQLIEIWENVLQFSPIGVQDNFFEIGGDSILSIQIIAKARKLGMTLSPNQLFDHQTIAELALFVSFEDQIADNTEEVITGDIALTPIQQWFFDTHINAPHFWNQNMQLNNLAPHMSDMVPKVIQKIVEQHDALRLSFTKKEGVWHASILAPEAMNAYEYVDFSNEEDIEAKKASCLNEVQHAMDLSKGNLFKAIYVKTGLPSGDCCMLLAHHLVIDVVSWQVLSDQIISAIQQETSDNVIHLPIKTSSIKRWIDHLSQTIISEEELSFWKDQVLDIPELPTDQKLTLPIVSKDIETIAYTLDHDVTEAISKRANETYSTKTDELLITALVHTLCHWSGNETLSLSLERHGRETNHTDLDLSNTVGWFTSFFPVKLHASSGSFGDKIITIKEQMRKIPNSGIGYGISRYLTKQLPRNQEPTVVFNFLGKQDLQAEEGSLNMSPILEGVHHPMSERNYVLEINCYITNGQLHMRWGYSTFIHHTETIEHLIQKFNEAVDEIIEHCDTQEEGKYTPSDFPEVELNQDDLDNLLENLL
ncbi:condensation domain-containing protein [Spongiimicrobium salis]|uniref:condensation domain-containing protein n=1 Tax=Spongiimicrobium salis TaxID=1667022 RepID=UPI00374D9206